VNAAAAIKAGTAASYYLYQDLGQAPTGAGEASATVLATLNLNFPSLPEPTVKWQTSKPTRIYTSADYTSVIVATVDKGTILWCDQTGVLYRGHFFYKIISGAYSGNYVDVDDTLIAYTKVTP
jgi:hypothetical protein